MPQLLHPLADQLHQPSDVLRRRLRQNSMAEVENERTPGQRLQNFRRLALHPSPTRSQHQRVKISLHDRLPGELLRHELERCCRIAAHAVHSRLAHIRTEIASGTHRKTDDGNPWMALLDARDY